MLPAHKCGAHHTRSMYEATNPLPSVRARTKVLFREEQGRYLATEFFEHANRRTILVIKDRPNVNLSSIAVTNYEHPCMQIRITGRFSKSVHARLATQCLSSVTTDEQRLHKIFTNSDADRGADSQGADSQSFDESRMSIRRFTRLAEYVFQKSRESCGCCSGLVHVLQFLPSASNLACDPGDGGCISAHVWTVEEIAALLDSK
jgi:hypothetical protein